MKIEQTKFKCFPLGKIFNKALSESGKKEGLLKKLKNIERENEEQLKAIESQEEKKLNEINDWGKINQKQLVRQG